MSGYIHIIACSCYALGMLYKLQCTVHHSGGRQILLCGFCPPPPFTDKIFGKKGVTGMGGTPSPLYGHLFAPTRALKVLVCY